MTHLENNGIFEDGYFYDKIDLIDLYRLQMVLLKEQDIVVNLEECINIWQNFSNDLSASWLFFPKKDIDILRYISSSDYFTSYSDYSKPII